MTPDELKAIVEGALFAAGRALSIEQLQALFEEGARPDAGSLRAILMRCSPTTANAACCCSKSLLAGASKYVRMLAPGSAGYGKSAHSATREPY